MGKGAAVGASEESDEFELAVVVDMEVVEFEEPVVVFVGLLVVVVVVTLKL
jgi:hypothetical protein